MFDISSGDVKLTFNTIPERVMHLVNRATADINDNNQGHGGETSVIDNVIEKNQVQFGLILTQIAHNPSITIKELAAKLEISDRQVARRIKELKELSVIQRVGSDRRGTWIVK